MSSEAVPTIAETREAGEEIARRGGPKAAGLLVSIMESNARAAERDAKRQEDYRNREIEHWKARALAAEANLERIERRLLGLLR